MIKINFDDTFDPIELVPNLSIIKFNSPLKNNSEQQLIVKVLPLGDPLLPNVYNLSFGPIGADGEIDDQAKIEHENTDKVFSSILFYSLIFLQRYPDLTIGIDGSNDVRAYLYHRMIITNRVYLSEYFVTTGTDWYVRLLRNGNIELDSEGNAFFKPKPEPFDFKRQARDLYRYYMFRLKA
ncbi:MAG: hypothetical protein IT236_07155 [Bacteroidia bacterium]|nr:hypothetical protein [Bacteroidia bacterium]